jgi:hypothetical protein
MATTPGDAAATPDSGDPRRVGRTPVAEIRETEEFRALAADIYADGAIGFMVNSRGIVKFGLYQEVINLGTRDATRHIVARVIMHRETAKEMANWLINNVNTTSETPAQDD